MVAIRYYVLHLQQYSHKLNLLYRFTQVLHPSISYGKEMNSVILTIISPYAKTYTNVITG